MIRGEGVGSCGCGCGVVLDFVSKCRRVKSEECVGREETGLI